MTSIVPTTAARLVLASASSGRLAVLTGAGIDVDVVVSGVDEDAVKAGDAVELVQTLADLKAHAVAERLRAEHRDSSLVLGCDSMLELDGEVLGKPANADEALARWERMAGRTGLLHTGHCLVSTATGDAHQGVATTEVRFGRPDADELAAYVASGEPTRVAGAFAIDGLAGPFVEGIDGDHGNVIGLSLPLLRRLLQAHGVRITDLWRNFD